MKTTKTSSLENLYFELLENQKSFDQWIMVTEGT